MYLFDYVSAYGLFMTAFYAFKFSSSVDIPFFINAIPELLIEYHIGIAIRAF
jgi:hypothetical protein